MLLQGKLPIYADVDFSDTSDPERNVAWANMARAENRLADSLLKLPMGIMATILHTNQGWMVWPHDETGKITLFFFSDVRDPECDPVARCDEDLSWIDAEPSEIEEYAAACEMAEHGGQRVEASMERIDLMLSLHHEVMMREMKTEHQRISRELGFTEAGDVDQRLYRFLGGELVSNKGHAPLRAQTRILQEYQRLEFSPQDDLLCSMKEINGLFGQAWDVWKRLPKDAQIQYGAHYHYGLSVMQCIKSGDEVSEAIATSLAHGPKVARRSDSDPTP